MSRIELEVLSQAPNQAIVQMPGRAFPGSVVQGDSLTILWQLSRSVRDRARRGQDSDLVDEAEELFTLLQGRLLHYQRVLQAQGIRLPYGEAVKEEP